MIVVTGTARGGTSLMMQTLALLGVPMCAPKFLPLHEPIKDFNKNGFYELDIWDGITTDEYKDKAIKLFGYQYFKTPLEKISKTIRINRDKKDTIESYNRIKEKMPPEYHVDSEKLYDMNNYYIDKKENDNKIEIELNEFCRTKNVEQIISYLGITPTSEQINNAKNNIQCQ